MDFLLRRKYNYSISNSFQIEKDKLEKILKGRPLDFTKTISGVMNNDGTFTFCLNLLPFWRFNIVRIVYLKGEILNNSDDTMIKIILLPNAAFVCLLYLLPLISLNILFGDNSLMSNTNTRLNNFVVLLFSEIILFMIIQIVAFALRRKFENVLRITPN